MFQNLYLKDSEGETKAYDGKSTFIKGNAQAPYLSHILSSS